MVVRTAGRRLPGIRLGLPEPGNRLGAAPGRVVHHIAIDDGRRRQLDRLRNRARRGRVPGLRQSVAGDRQGEKIAGKESSHMDTLRRYGHGFPR